MSSDLVACLVCIEIKKKIWNDSQPLVDICFPPSVICCVRELSSHKLGLLAPVERIPPLLVVGVAAATAAAAGCRGGGVGRPPAGALVRTLPAELELQGLYRPDPRQRRDAVVRGGAGVAGAPPALAARPEVRPGTRSVYVITTSGCSTSGTPLPTLAASAGSRSPSRCRTWRPPREG